MTKQTPKLRPTLIAGAVLALTACGGGSGGGGDNEVTPPVAPPTQTTQELVQKYMDARQALTATQLPAKGTERFAHLDDCYLGNGSSKERLVTHWDENQTQVQASNAYQIGRSFENLQILAERKATNADGSARHEVDISYDEKFTDGTSTRDQRETLIAGSSSGTCATPRNAAEMRSLGNQRVVSVGLVSRNRANVIRQLSDGEPSSSPFHLRREVQFGISDPARLATYAIVSWPSAKAGGARNSLKLLSPRIMRDAPEMQGVRGNASYADTNNFRQCRSNASNDVANAGTADCTNAQLGVANDSWGSTVRSGFDAAAMADGDNRFAALGLAAGTEVRFDIHADDGWKAVNGQQGKTPIATYQVTLKSGSYAFAQIPVNAYPPFNTISPSEGEIVAGFKAGGGSAQVVWSAAQPPAGSMPMALSVLSSYRQGAAAGSASGLPTVRTPNLTVPVPKGATSATIPFGGKPDGASATNYAEFLLVYADRNGREMYYNLQYTP